MYQKLILSLSLLFSYSAFSMDFTLAKSIVRSKDVSIIHNKDGFYTECNGIREKALIEKKSPLFKMNAKQVQSFIKMGSYLTVDKLPNGQTKLSLHSKLKGGGPILAWWGYGITKSVLYGLGIVGIGAGVAATGGGIGMVAGGAVALSTAGGTGAAVVAGVVTGAGTMGAGVTAASVTGVTTTLITTGGSWGLISGGIEAASMAVGGLLALVPWL